MPLVEGPSLAVDTIGTFFILPFLTTLIITTAVWHELREGRLAPLIAPDLRLLARLPRNTRAPRRLLRPDHHARARAAGGAALVLRDPTDVSVGDFVLYKAIFGVVLGRS